jgi:hypothetical protein
VILVASLISPRAATPNAAVLVPTPWIGAPGADSSMYTPGYVV